MTERDQNEALRSLLDDTQAVEVDLASKREDAIWSTILERSIQRSKHRRRWQLVGSSAFAVALAGGLVGGLLPATTSLSAAATLLHKDATLDASAANLPTLGAGDYYHESSSVQMFCGFNGPSTASDPIPPSILYVTTGVRNTWTSDTGGKVDVIVNPTGVGGSNFATTADEAQWVAEGKPENACNPDGTSTGEPGGVSFYGGFGFAFQADSSQQSDAGEAINELPSDPATLGQMLELGEINQNGTTSPTPQVCPWVMFAPGAAVQPTQPPAPAGTPTGCSPIQEAQLIVALMQLPDASAKLGSTLYTLLAQMPGSTLAGTTNVNGIEGTVVTLPLGANETLSVVIDPETGALLRCTVTFLNQTDSNTGTVIPVSDVITYGGVSIVHGIQ
jgi:hypothetical protein